ncbi:hypothetical protein WN48_09247 [Eufriesea mexicana]|nr:hypothetical protein WN48_09247 [Eufriesea mexicana]
MTKSTGSTATYCVYLDKRVCLLKLIYKNAATSTCAWCGSGGLPRRKARWAQGNVGYFRHFGGGAATVEAGNGGEGDGVAAARDHPPDGAPPCPAFCCPERPAGSTTSNAPATTQTFPSSSKLHLSFQNIYRDRPCETWERRTGVRVADLAAIAKVEREYSIVGEVEVEWVRHVGRQTGSGGAIFVSRNENWVACVAGRRRKYLNKTARDKLRLHTNCLVIKGFAKSAAIWLRTWRKINSEPGNFVSANWVTADRPVYQYRSSLSRAFVISI